MNAYRSSLAPMVGRSGDPDPAAPRRLAREAWRSTGFVVIDPKWLDRAEDRAALIVLAGKVHGERVDGI